MTIDLAKMRELAARADELEGQGYSPTQVESIIDREQAEAAARRTSLQEQRGALNADAAPPGQEPDADPYDSAFAAARATGAAGATTSTWRLAWRSCSQRPKRAIRE
jgi:hypothetical protein